MFHKNYFVLILLLLVAAETSAQLSFVKGKEVYEMGFNFTSFYNQRFYQSGETNFDKNRFRVRDAQMDIKMRSGNKCEASLQFDLADIASGSTADEDNGLMEANVVFKPIYRGPEFKLGFDKVAFSRSSSTSLYASPFFNRAEIVSGDFFARRDVGLELKQGFLNDRIIAYGGIYTGLGEASLAGDNDASGKPEYIGRVEFSYPSKFRYVDYDRKNSAKPMISLGLNGRYAEKKTDSGIDYIKTVDGKKSVYGFDVALMWKGFNFQYELLQAHIIPNDSFKVVGSGDNYINAGGYLMQLTYNNRKLNSGLAVRYDEINPNDLVLDNTFRSVNIAYNYFISNSEAIIKIQYMHRLPLAVSNTQWKEDDLRVGLQYNF
jgi:hypothetical protein